MRGMGMASEDYMQAFMSGFDFVLLAMEGRIQESALGSEERARLQGFLEDYWRISKAYHQRREAPAPAGISVKGPVVADVPPLAAN